MAGNDPNLHAPVVIGRLPVPRDEPAPGYPEWAPAKLHREAGREAVQRWLRHALPCRIRGAVRPRRGHYGDCTRRLLHSARTTRPRAFRRATDEWIRVLATSLRDPALQRSHQQDVFE